MLVTAIALGTLAAGQLSPSAEQQASLPQLLVTDVKTETGFDASTARLLTEVILTEFQKSGRYRVVGGSDLVALLSLEQQRQLVDCNADSCLAEVAGALNTDLLLVSSIGTVGGVNIVNLKLIDAKSGKVLARASADLPVASDQLADLVRGAARQILELASAPTTGSPRTLLWVAAGGAVFLFAGSAVAMALRPSEAEIHDGTYADYVAGAAADQSRLYRQVRADVDRRNNLTHASWALLAGGLAATGVVAWSWLSPGDKDVSATVTAGDHGAALSVQGAF